jgi:hypothetical protein
MSATYAAAAADAACGCEKYMLKANVYFIAS